MIQNSFRNTVKELKGLINDEIWSALSDGLHEFCPSGMPDMLLAVSGGMDSMCMAHLYLECFGNRSFAIAHCNFNLRAEESDSDEAMVRSWAQENDVRFHSTSFSTVSYARSNGLSIEMAARELRYRWFAELCLAYGYRSIAVAHHAEDNAETLILNMVRGTGMRGLAGMKSISPVPYSDESSPLRLLRPLLGFSRKQIEGYVLRYRVPYRTDSTNASVEYRRNRIRHEVFPILSKLNPSFVATLNREMEYFADASDIVDEWCRSTAPDVLFPPEERSPLCHPEERSDVRISIPRLLSKKSWRYLLYHILEPYGFNSAILSSVENLLLSQRTISGKRFHSSTHMLVTERDMMIVSPLEQNDDNSDPIIIEGAGLYKFNDTIFSVEVCPWSADQPLKQPEGVMIFDASALTFPFVCRSWQKGDWMIPLGMRGKRKLSDIFKDLKWNARKKTSVPVIVKGYEDEGQRVAAILGVHMDDGFKVGEGTEMIVRIKIS